MQKGQGHVSCLKEIKMLSVINQMQLIIKYKKYENSLDVCFFLKTDLLC